MKITDDMLTEEQRSAVEIALSLIGLSSDPRVQKAYKGLRSLLTGRRTTPDRGAWQPIETAPKDGKRVLVFEPGSRGGVWVAHFLRYPGKPDQWVNPGCHKINPTHWMPLPAAPTSDKGGA